MPTRPGRQTVRLTSIRRILQLVRAREGDGSYVPIPEGDVAAAKMPPLREPDAYLKSRLDQFYAELQACFHPASRVCKVYCSIMGADGVELQASPVDATASASPVLSYRIVQLQLVQLRESGHPFGYTTEAACLGHLATVTIVR